MFQRVIALVLFCASLTPCGSLMAIGGDDEAGPSSPIVLVCSEDDALSNGQRRLLDQLYCPDIVDGDMTLARLRRFKQHVTRVEKG